MGKYLLLKHYRASTPRYPVTAARLYAEAARSAANWQGRDHLRRQAAPLNAERRG